MLRLKSSTPLIRDLLPVRKLIGFLVVSLASFSALAQPVPKLDSLSATWFQRGTTNEVTLNGDALVGVKELLFTGLGTSGNFGAKTAAGVTLEGSAGGISVGAADTAKLLSVRLIVAADAPLGARELRVAGPNGVSNPLILNVSDLPEQLELKPNNQPAEAPLLALPVAGRNASRTFWSAKLNSAAFAAGASNARLAAESSQVVVCFMGFKRVLRFYWKLRAGSGPVGMAKG